MKRFILILSITILLAGCNSEENIIGPQISVNGDEIEYYRTSRTGKPTPLGVG